MHYGRLIRDLLPAGASAPIACVRKLLPRADPPCAGQLEEIDRLFRQADAFLVRGVVEREIFDLVFADEPTKPARTVEKILLPWLMQLAITYPEQVSRLKDWPAKLRLGEAHLRALAQSGTFSSKQLIELARRAGDARTRLCRILGKCAAMSQDSSWDRHAAGLPIALASLPEDRWERFLAFWPIGHPAETATSVAGEVRSACGCSAAPGVSGIDPVRQPDPPRPPRPLNVRPKHRSRLSAGSLEWLLEASTRPLLAPLWRHGCDDVFEFSPLVLPEGSRDAAVFLLESEPPPPDPFLLQALVRGLLAGWTGAACLPRRTILSIAASLGGSSCGSELVVVCLEACLKPNPSRLLGLRERLETLAQVEPAGSGCAKALKRAAAKLSGIA